MGPEEKNLGDFYIYIGDELLGKFDTTEIPKFEGDHAILDKNTGNIIATLQRTETNMEFHFTADMWRCRNRKRFIKLMTGAFNVQRNDAQHLADECMEAGCPSYLKLWVSYYAFFAKSAFNYMYKKISKERNDAQ